MSHFIVQFVNIMTHVAWMSHIAGCTIWRGPSRGSHIGSLLSLLRPEPDPQWHIVGTYALRNCAISKKLNSRTMYSPLVTAWTGASDRLVLPQVRLIQTRLPIKARLARQRCHSIDLFDATNFSFKSKNERPLNLLAVPVGQSDHG